LKPVEKKEDEDKDKQEGDDEKKEDEKKEGEEEKKEGEEEPVLSEGKKVDDDIIEEVKPQSRFASLRKYNKWLTLFGFILFPLILEIMATTLPPKFYRNDDKL